MLGSFLTFIAKQAPQKVIGLHREDKYLLLVAHATKDTKLNMHMSAIGVSQPGMDLFS